MTATFTELTQSVMRGEGYSHHTGWEYRFVKRMDAGHGMGEALAWCKENLTGEYQQRYAYILMKNEDDAFRFKLRFC